MGGYDFPEDDGTDTTPIPKRDFYTLMFIVMNESLGVSMLYPFVGLLIVHLDGSIREADAGMMSGLAVGCFHIAQALFGILLGRQSDRWGRKPMLAIGLFFGAIFSVCVGFSTSIWELLLFRFLFGAANGTAALCKSMLADLTTPRSAALGWSLLSIGWALGHTMGPTLGGVLYDPAHQISYSTFGGTVFETYPALLPSLVGAVYSLVSIALCLVLLPESNKHAAPPRWLSTLMSCGTSGNYAPAASNETEMTVEVTVHQPDGEVAQPKSASASPVERGKSPTQEDRPTETYGLRDMWSSFTLRRLLIIFSVLCVCNTSFSEVLPLLAILPIAEGGLGLGARPIGFIFMILAGEAILTNSVFPRLTKRFSRKNIFQWSAFVWGISLAFTPVLSLEPFVGNTLHSVVFASIYLFARTAVSTWAFAIIPMALSDNAPRIHIGTATGVGQAFANFFRAFLPPFSTMLFAWSVGTAASTPAPAATTVAHSLDFVNHTTLTTASVAPLWSNLTPVPVLLNAAVAAHHHPFPFDKWLCFIVLGIAMLSTIALQRALTDADYHRAPASPTVASPSVAKGKFPPSESVVSVDVALEHTDAVGSSENLNSIVSEQTPLQDEA